MSNLPIMSSMPQAAVSKPATNSADNGAAQSAQPFGEVLARQNAKEGKTDCKAEKADCKTERAERKAEKEDCKPVKIDCNAADDALALLGANADFGKQEVATAADANVVPADSAPALPAEILAALLPQGMNPAAAAAAAATNAKSGGPAIDTSAALDRRAGAASKTQLTPGIQAELTPQEETGADPAATLKGPAFAAALAESTGRTGLTPNAAAREAVSAAAAAAPQPNATALAALQNSAAGIAAPVVQAVQATVSTPVTQSKWADEFSQKITWLASSGKEQTAELHLNPPQLGPLNVVIKVSGDQATALFTSPHAAVREAIEQAMPRLRDMMADNGIMLGNATVSDQTPRDQGQSGTPRASTATANDIRDIAPASDSAPRVSPISRHNGIVDTFA
ncbi:MAG: flagellar hook-length control protein FliK [Sideroxyarcus sp.]|nr:flagellar hook-length control protein FliK [Sideroxyarcus sp.]